MINQLLMLMFCPSTYFLIVATRHNTSIIINSIYIIYFLVSSRLVSLSVSLDRGRAQLDSSERELLKEIRELRQKLAARANEGSSASSQSVHALSSVSQWPQLRLQSQKNIFHPWRARTTEAVTQTGGHFLLSVLSYIFSSAHIPALLSWSLTINS